MSPSLLLFMAGLLLVFAALAVFLAQRAERRRAREVGAFVDHHMKGAAAARAVSSPAPVPNAARPGERQEAAKRRFERVPVLDNLLLRAGVTNQTAWLRNVILFAVVLVLAAFVFGGALSAAMVIILVVALTWFRLFLMAGRRYKRIVRQIPAFLDNLIRQVTVGTSLGSAFQQIAPTVPAPLGELLTRAARQNRAGVELDVAVKQVARIYDVDSLYMIGAVLGVANQYGGRSDQVLERIAAFLRDIEQARDELIALSAETRLSAWVLGVLPLAVTCFIITFNNKFFVAMWQDPIGAKMLLGAAGLQIFGSFLLYRLAKSV